MLDARHHFLADVAALLEIDAGELVHVGFVRKRIEIHEVLAAARHAERDAMRIVSLRVDERRAQFGGGLSALPPAAPARARPIPAGADRRN